jgi:hypothetical protein
LSKDLRRNLFRLFSSWSGKYGMQFVTSASNKSSVLSEQVVQDKLTEFEFSALQAACASLCCGPCFDQQDLMEEGSIYPWLNRLMASVDEKVRSRCLITCERIKGTLKFQEKMALVKLFEWKLIHEL